MKMVDYLQNPGYDDYIAAYVPPSYPGVSQYLAAKKELQLPLDNFGHQELITRLMTFLPRLLVVHHTGSGKTCTAAKPAELFKRAMIDSTYWLLDAGRIDKVFVIVPNDALIDEFKYQISCVCTQNEYTSGITGNDTEEEKRKKVSKNIAASYEVMRLAKFLNMFDPKASARMEKKVSRIGTVGKRRLRNINELKNAYVIFDEGHLLLTDDERADVVDDDTGMTTVRHETMQTRSAKYDTTRSIVEACPTMKFVIFTGTPNRNSHNEIGQLQRLLTVGTYGYRMLPEDSDLATMDLNTFSSYFGGLVSVLRDPGNTDDIDIEYQVNPVVTTVPRATGIDPELLPNNLYITEMSGLQSRVYNDMALSKGMSQKALPEISTMIYPDESRNQIGVQKYLEPMDRVFPDPDLFRINPLHIQEFDPLWNHPELQGKAPSERLAILRTVSLEVRLTRIRELSCKFYDYMLRVSRAILMGKPGVFFAAVEFRQVGSIPLGAFLHHFLGMEPFTYDDMGVLFEPTGGAVCGSGGRSIRSTVPRIPRYAIISGATGKGTNMMGKKSRRVQCILEVMRSSANTDGSYIKVFIGTSAISLGVNLHAIDETDVFGGKWNQSAIKQITGRSIRTGSHRRLLEILRQLSQANPNIPLLRDGKVPVNIRLHAAESRTNMGTYMSIDEYMYMTAGEKQIGIDKVDEKLNCMDILCPITATRNGIATTMCYNPEGLSLPTDYSTYNNFYLKRDFGMVKEYVDTQIRKKGFLGITDVVKYFYDNEIEKGSPEVESRNYSEQLVMRGLSYLLNNRHKITQQLLQEASGVLFLGETGKFDETFYSRLNIGTTNISITNETALLGETRDMLPAVLIELMKVPLVTGNQGISLNSLAIDLNRRVFRNISPRKKAIIMELCISSVAEKKGKQYVANKVFDLSVPEERALEYFKHLFFGINNKALSSFYQFMKFDYLTDRSKKLGRIYNTRLLETVVRNFLSPDLEVSKTKQNKQNRNPGYIRAVENRHTGIKYLVYPRITSDNTQIDIAAYFRYLQVARRTDDMNLGSPITYGFNEEATAQIISGKRGYIDFEPYNRTLPDFRHNSQDRFTDLAYYLSRLASNTAELSFYMSLLPLDSSGVKYFFDMYNRGTFIPIPPRPINSIISVYGIYLTEKKATDMISSTFETNPSNGEYLTHIYKDNNWGPASSEENMYASIVWYDDYIRRLFATRPVRQYNDDPNEYRKAVLSDNQVYSTGNLMNGIRFVPVNVQDMDSLLLSLRNYPDIDVFLDMI